MDHPKTFVEGFHIESVEGKMTYTELPKKDIALSKLGIGGASLGNCYGTIDEADGKLLVREALRNGINYIDTSPYYGHRLSETLIGKALSTVPREAFYLSTKVGRYGTSWADYFDHSAQRIIDEFDLSLKRLGLDYVDILLVHDIEFSSLDQIVSEALPAVNSLKEKGKARYIGVAGYPLSVLRAAVERSPVPVDVVLTYARDCLFDATATQYMPFFQERGIGVVNASLTGMGLLTNGGPQVWHPAGQALKQLCRDAALYCQEQGVELGDLAVYEGLQRSGHCSHLVSMKSLTELTRNMSLATRGLSEHENNVLATLKHRYFDQTANHHWEGVELEELRTHREQVRLGVS